MATLEAVAAAGADAIEVGLPFSDPMMDGPVIQRASVQALADGATAHGIIAAIAEADVGIPIAVMTYYNIVARTGRPANGAVVAHAGISGAIRPDLPVDEVDGRRRSRRRRSGDCSAGSAHDTAGAAEDDSKRARGYCTRSA